MDRIYREYEMADGECIVMSISMALMYKLRSKDKTVYQNLSRICMNGVKDDDMTGIAEGLYGAYKCANQDEKQNMTFTEFVERMNPSFMYNARFLNDLIDPPKNVNSKAHSKRQLEGKERTE